MAWQLKDLIDRTVRAEKLAVLGQFATGVAHEVRNPLATMKTTVQALSRREQDEERITLLDDMGSQIDRLSRVVNDLLSYGRPGEAAPQATAIRELFRQTSILLEPVADEAHVRFFTSGDSRLNVYVDPEQILQIFFTMKSKGTGLGLTISQQLVDANHGTINIESAPQEGTTIILTFPASGPGIGQEEITKNVQADQNTDRRR